MLDKPSNLKKGNRGICTLIDNRLKSIINVLTKANMKLS